MAVAHARQVRVAAAEDGIVAVQRDVIVDPDTGVAAEVEKVMVAVDVGGGQIAVAEQQRVTGYVVGGAGGRASRPAIQAPPPRATPTYVSTSTPARDSDYGWLHLVNCLICIIFPPWIIVWICCCCILAATE